MTERGLPRLIEVLLATAGLLACAPVLAAIAVAVKASSRGPVLFRQERVGWNGKRFTLVKFRTMTVNAGSVEVTARDDRRITGVGRVLRKCKMDELPELWNVLLGEMSFVGPRPEVPRYVDLADSRWAMVVSVRPGLTDPVALALRNEEDVLAAVSGDRECFYRETLQPWKLAGYIEYIERRNAWTDLRVIGRTLVALALPRATEVRAFPWDRCPSHTSRCTQGPGGSGETWQDRKDLRDGASVAMVKPGYYDAERSPSRDS